MDVTQPRTGIDPWRTTMKLSVGFAMAWLALIAVFCVGDVVVLAWRGELTWLGLLGLPLTLGILALGAFAMFMLLKAYDAARAGMRRVFARLSR